MAAGKRERENGKRDNFAGVVVEHARIYSTGGWRKLHNEEQCVHIIHLYALIYKSTL
jgi:hypothetical protein